MNNAREMFYGSIVMERERQNRKFPNEQRHKSIPLHQWNTILTEEVGEFSREVNDREDLKALIELTETAAVCFKIAEVYFADKPELLMQAFKYISERAENQEAKEKI